METCRSSKKHGENLSGSNWIVKIVNGKHPVSALGELHQAIGKSCPEYLEERINKGGFFRVKCRTAWGEFLGPEGVSTKKEAKSRSAYYALQQVIQKEAAKYGMPPPVEACDSSWQTVAWIPTNTAVPKTAKIAVGYKHFTAAPDRPAESEQAHAPDYFQQNEGPPDDRARLNPDLIPAGLRPGIRPPTPLMSGVNPQVRLNGPPPRVIAPHRIPVRAPIAPPSRGPPPVRAARPALPLMQGIANWLGQQTRIRGAMSRGALPPGAHQPPPPGMDRHPPPPGTRQYQHMRGPPPAERYRPSPERYQPPPPDHYVPPPDHYAPPPDHYAPPPDHYQPPPPEQHPPGPYQPPSPDRYKMAQAMCYPSAVPGTHPWDEVPPNMQ